MLFWFAAIVFFGTYILIASEKVHKTTAALIGSSLMLFVILKGPSHNGGGDKVEKDKITHKKTVSETI